MKQISQIIEAQQRPNLPQLFQESSPQIQNNSISVYRGELTTKCIVDQVKKMKYAFPSLQAGFYDLLTDRIKELKFCDERLTDAVNYTIDNCIYPTPTIASIISFDKRIKLYSYNDMTEMANKYGGRVFSEYKAIKVNGHRVYASVIDIETYNLKSE